MKAIILFSGGLDSTVMLAMAIHHRRECVALSFDYSQRHRIELKAAGAIAQYYDIPHHIFAIDPLIFQGSALVGLEAIAKNRSPKEIANNGIPNTYVPARNTLFLAYAMGLAEQLKADEIHFGANASDRTCYPDCRPAFMQAFQEVLNVATQQACEQKPMQLITPLANWDKEKIIRQGKTLKAPLEMTMSCYDPTNEGLPCHGCNACLLRDDGFSKANRPLK